MKMIVVAFALFAVAIAAPPVANEVAEIVRAAYESDPAKGYDFSFETSNGIQRQELGELKQVVDKDNKPQDVVAVRGQYSYVDNEGVTHSVTYEADENGFRAFPKPARR